MGTNKNHYPSRVFQYLTANDHTLPCCILTASSSYFLQAQFQGSGLHSIATESDLLFTLQGTAWHELICCALIATARCSGSWELVAHTARLQNQKLGNARVQTAWTSQCSVFCSHLWLHLSGCRECWSQWGQWDGLIGVLQGLSPWCCKDQMILMSPLNEGERFGELERAGGTGF